MRNSLLLILLFFTTITNAQVWEERNTTPFELDHGFAFSLNGKGYFVTGGVSDGFTTTFTDAFYSYDVATDSWEQLDDFPGTARGYAVGAVWNGKAYFGFGVDAAFNDLNDLWVFDPQTESWSELTTCDCVGRGHPAFVIMNDKIFVGLGNNFIGNLNDWWVYDINSNNWSEGEDFPSHERHHPYYFAIGDYVYVGMGHGNFMVGGFNIYNDLYRYNPQTNVWEEMEGLPGEGRVAGTQFNYSGKGYALSGQGNDHWFMDDGEFWEYDPAGNNWTNLPSHPGVSRWAPGSFIIDQYVYLISGTTTNFIGGNEVYSNEVWRYDLGVNTVSIDEVRVEDTFEIHTTNNAIVIDSELTEQYFLSVYNVMGQEVLSQNIYDQRINIDQLKAGVYVLSVKTDNKEVKNMKFVKQ